MIPIKMGFLFMFINGFWYSRGFFIIGRDVRKFFGGVIPTFYDVYRREASEERVVEKHKKYEHNINEKLNKLLVHTKEKPDNILHYENYGEHGNIGHYTENTDKKNGEHFQRIELHRLRDLDRKLKSGLFKIIKGKSETDHLKNHHVGKDYPEFEYSGNYGENPALRFSDNFQNSHSKLSDYEVTKVNSDFALRNNDYLNPDSSLYGQHHVESEVDYFGRYSI
ncbi:hypothetical protein JTB14_017740 [Gonioctena quinquepunctata]|nr:hypothetical protein JTB14_017740 [Gonioctena quinquepunctata]